MESDWRRNKISDTKNFMKKLTLGELNFCWDEMQMRVLHTGQVFSKGVSTKVEFLIGDKISRAVDQRLLFNKIAQTQSERDRLYEQIKF